MSIKPKVLVMRGYGINSHEELAAAFTRAGADAEFKHLTELLANPKLLDDYQGLGLPGGFSGGDYLGAGKFLANLIQCSPLKDSLERKLSDPNFPIYAVCNSMQILAKLDLFPVPLGTVQNDVGKHMTGFWDMIVNQECDSVWLSALKKYDGPIFAPISHGEGKVYIPKKYLQQVKELNLIALTYAPGKMHSFFKTARGDIYNPNGSTMDIAGLAWSSNLVLFPHFERILLDVQRPDREDARREKGKTTGAYEPTRLLFKAAVDAMK